MFPICSTIMEHPVHVQMIIFNIFGMFEAMLAIKLKHKEKQKKNKTAHILTTLSFEQCVFQLNNMPYLFFVLCY